MRPIRMLAAVILLAVGTAVVPMAGNGHAQALSEGCNSVNNAGFDEMYNSGGISPLPFLAGETITVSAGPPTSFSTPTATELRVNDAVVATGGFPATLSFTVPADGDYGVGWTVNNSANATWNVECVPQPVCTITGTPAGDLLTGTDGPDVICGLGGGDAIDGRGGNDVVLGGAGGDAIRGGSGQDRLLGEAGSDAIDGRDGAGGDVVVGGPGADFVIGDPGDSVSQ